MIFLFKKNKFSDETNNSSDSNNPLENSIVIRKDAFIKKLENIVETNQEEYGQQVLSLAAKEKEILQGVIFILNESAEPPKLQFLSGYACNNDFNKELSFEPGEGLPGQVFRDKKMLNLKDFPEGYIKIRTGLGEASPNSLLLIPLFISDVSLGVIEIASFQKFTEEDELFFSEISKVISRQLLDIKNSIVD